MTDTTHEVPEKMKTIRLTVDLTYDQEVMHGDDEDAIVWFNSILAGKDLQLGDFGELGDMIGSVKVVTQKDDLVQQDDDDFHPATAGDDPIYLGGVEYITKSRSDDLVQAAVAAALVMAADTVEDWGRLLSGTEDVSEEVIGDILALITPDAQAALDRALLAEVRAVKDSLTAAYIELAAERERCAKVAESVALPMDGRNAKAQADYMSKVIASAIREGGE